MRATLTALVLIAVTTGCGAEAPKKAPAPAPTSATKLVQSRYGDCLAKLHAKNAEDIGGRVEFETDRGLLVFKVTKLNTGKTYTVPDRAKDAKALTSVGC